MWPRASDSRRVKPSRDRDDGREPGDQDRTGKRGRPFKRRFGEPEEKAQENFTDPDSRIMKRGSSGYEQCYNVQIAVDESERIIVATGVTQSSSDVHQLVPLLEQVESNTGVRPDCVLADAGYRSEPNLQHLEQQQIEGFAVLARNNDGSHPAPDPKLKATCRMVKKMRTPRGGRQYAKRKYLAEPPFAWIKWVIGFNRFHLRGRTKVSCEWDLACLAVNLRRMQGKIAWT